MKYYHKTRTFTYLDGENKEYDMGYDIKDLPVNKPIWAVAYDINNDTAHVNLRCLPTLGEIVLSDPPENSRFKAYKKGSSEFKVGWVGYNARWYADTFEEAVELYNGLVQKRIKRLKDMLIDAECDILSKGDEA